MPDTWGKQNKKENTGFMGEGYISVRHGPRVVYTPVQPIHTSSRVSNRMEVWYEVYIWNDKRPRARKSEGDRSISHPTRKCPRLCGTPNQRRLVHTSLDSDLPSLPGSCTHTDPTPAENKPRLSMS